MVELAKLSHTYKNRIMGSMALKRADLEEALIKIFNFFNGVFPNYFKLILYFPEYLINHWNVWTEVVIEDGPLSFEYRLVIGLMVSTESGICGMIIGVLEAILSSLGGLDPFYDVFQNLLNFFAKNRNFVDCDFSTNFDRF